MPREASWTANSANCDIQHSLYSRGSATSVRTKRPRRIVYNRVYVVSPGSRPDSTSDTVSEVVVDPVFEPEGEIPDEVIEVEVEPKATGVRVMPVRSPRPAVEPKATAPMTMSPDCTDIPPDSVYTCQEQVVTLCLTAFAQLSFPERVRKV